MLINPPREKWTSLVKRPELDQKDLGAIISKVFEEVRKDGDQALFQFTEKFDNVKLTSLELTKEGASIGEDLQEAIEVASSNIRKFHESQIHETSQVETTSGVVCWQESRAIETIGLYIPGGSAPLFSTVLMLAIPAHIAGCKEIVLCTPPNENGGIDPAIEFSAKVAGITKIFTIGGAQAIAAMSLGTESVPKVQKIFGPGNQYVTAAKQYALSIGTAIDMPAGPSELLVIASENANAEYVAADLLSQAEHGADSQVICIAKSAAKLSKIENQIKEQKAILNSKFIVFEDEKHIFEFSNKYAPEHLIIADDNYERYISEIHNAGSVFLGNYCPESAGDYASGTNHTLPTAGYAKMYSGVNLDSFVKKITFQKISKKGLRNIGSTIEIMAAAEGLHAHKNAVSIRLKDL
ncbi:UNVERIFIED_CONTAM: hypothetical protein GTU68_048215 [Idotea baltica]|nr:hypothetical protein [Idotea baltica]